MNIYPIHCQLKYNKCLSLFICPLLLLLFCFLCGCQTTKRNFPITKSGFALDTFITISIYDSKDTAILDECFTICNVYEKQLSRTIADSDIGKINASNGLPVQVSAETIDLLQKGIDYGNLSQGLFDITIAPASSLWDFTSGHPVLPKDSAIQEALPLISYRDILLDTEAHTVTLKNAGSAIDLGGIAKGYIADRIKDYLIKEGITSAIIDLGGNILTIGLKPDQSKFLIGIKEPFSETGDVLTGVYVRNKSVVTSGTYQRCFWINDVLYHHILNPKTGYPADTGLNSVTIISDGSADGDALSTICLLLGLQDGLSLIESLPDVEAVFITDHNELFYSSGMDAYREPIK